MAAWVRIGTAFYLALALPGLIFGFLVKVDPLGRLCEPPYSLLDTFHPPTTGEPCVAFDFTPFYGIVPAIALVVIGLAVARARVAT
jgi:hypothetical protein